MIMSLMADVASLDAEIRQLQQAVKHSMSSSAITHHDSTVHQLTVNNVNDDTTLPASLFDGTTHVAKPRLVDSGASLQQPMDSDNVDHGVVETNTCRELQSTTERCDSDTHVGRCVTCQQFMMSADSSLSDKQLLSVYSSCCSKLHQLINASTSQHPSAVHNK